MSRLEPVYPPPGFGSGVARADVTVHPIKSSTPFQMATDFTFDGVTPFADAYMSRPCDAPDAFGSALLNAPPGATVHDAAYWASNVIRSRT